MSIIRSILPSLCELCRCASADCLCPDCEADLPVNHDACPICALPLSSTERSSECPACLVRPKPFDFSVCAYVYTHPLDQLVLRFKRKGPHALLPTLAGGLINAIQAAYANTNKAYPEAIVPVPQHWRRLLSRGFHPTRLLAEHLGRAIDLPVLPQALVSKHGTHQKTLGRHARLRGLAGAFDVQPAQLPRTLAIVDDVVTTGATAETLTTLLKPRGVEEVHIWALARAP